MSNRLYLITTFALIFSLCVSNVSAQQQKSNVESSLIDRLEMYEAQVKSLIGRLEVLERDYHRMQQLLDSTKIDQVQVHGHENTQPSQILDKITAQPKNLARARDSEAPSMKEEYTLSLTTLKEAGSIFNREEKENKLTEAQQRFERFIENNPNSSMIANAYFWIGEALFQKQQYKEAITKYSQSYTETKKQGKVSDSLRDKSADSLLRIATALSKIGECQAACKVINKLDKEFPAASRSSDSLNYSREVRDKCGCK